MCTRKFTRMLCKNRKSSQPSLFLRPLENIYCFSSATNRAVGLECLLGLLCATNIFLCPPPSHLIYLWSSESLLFFFSLEQSTFFSYYDSLFYWLIKGESLWRVFTESPYTSEIYIYFMIDFFHFE